MCSRASVGEKGLGAQELLLTRNRFEARDHNFLSGFFALDMLQETADFPNAQDEFAGVKSAVPPINQNIIVADNTFATDHPQALVNVSSANHVLLYRNSIRLESHVGEPGPLWYDQDRWGGSVGPAQYPVTIHDASHIFFDETSTYL